MAELTMTTFLSLDGVMQAPGAPNEDPSGNFPYGGWLVPHADPEAGKIKQYEYGRYRQCLPECRSPENRLVRLILLLIHD